MTDVSFDCPPVNGETAHQSIDGVVGVRLGGGGKAGVFAGSENVGVPQDLLYLLKADSGFDQVSGITVSKAMGADLFFRPQLVATFFIAT